MGELYRQISVRMWVDQKFRRLTPSPPCGQSLWVYLLTGPHTINIPGVIPCNSFVIGAALRWEPDAFRYAFREVIAEGLAKVDEEAGLIWLPNGPKHNPPQSVNAVKAWAKTWPLVPECALKSEMWTGLDAFLVGMSDAFRHAFREGCPKPCGTQEQEQEQDQDQDQESGVRVPPAGAGGAMTPNPRKPQKQKPKRVRRNRDNSSPHGPSLGLDVQPDAGPDPDLHPMPYTVAQVMETLHEGSDGFVATTPCVPGHAVQITSRIRELHAVGVTLGDVRLAAEYVAARWDHGLDLGPGWVASEGKLADAVAKARRWRDSGRPARGVGSGCSAMKADPNNLSGEQMRAMAAKLREEKRNP